MTGRPVGPRGLAVLLGAVTSAIAGCRAGEPAAAVTPPARRPADAGIARADPGAAAPPASTEAAGAWINALSARDVDEAIAASGFPFFLELRDMDAAARCPAGALPDAGALRAALLCLLGSQEVVEILAGQREPPEVGAASPALEVTRQEKPGFPAAWIERHGHAAVRVGTYVDYLDGVLAARREGPRTIVDAAFLLRVELQE